MTDRVLMRPPDGGDPQEVDATPEVLVPLLVQGYSQCDPPEEVTEDVREHS